MLYISHRINTTRELESLPASYGVELDIRDSGKRLVVTHDAFGDGEDFEEYVKAYKHAFMIPNVKSEGVEEKVLEVLKKNNISNFFLLDLSLPALVRLAKAGEKRIAVRFSEFEPVELALSFKGLIEWVWVDCFTRFPMTLETYQKLKPHFKLCLVSPELQKYPVEQIKEFSEKIKSMPFDAVCTQRVDLWEKYAAC